MTVKDLDPAPAPAYIALVTTLFQFPEGEVALTAGHPVTGLSDSQIGLLLNLKFVERRESARTGPVTIQTSKPQRSV